MTVAKFNPAFLTDEQLEAAFVARQHELETLLDVVRGNTGPVNQHVLVVAPRGYGKTTLALRLAAAVRADPELRSRWLPVPFAEESYLVATPGELWLEAVRRLAAVTRDPGDQAAADDLGRDRDEDRLAARALAWLRGVAAQRCVRLLLVVENLQDLLSDQVSADHAWTLRKVLQHEPWLMVLGTAVDRFDAMDQPDQAMFDLFRRVDLPPLDPADCDRVWGHVTSDPLGARRAKAIRILTGGNPRLLVILAAFAKDRRLRDVLQAFDALIDERTDYLKDNIESIPPKPRRVFLALAELWQPALARTVAERARMEVNETSAALSRLQDQGRVMVARTQGKNHYYQLAERLYNLYVLLRLRGGSQDRVRAVLDFLRYLYRPEDRREIVHTIATDACGQAPHARADHLSIVGHFLTTPRGGPIVDELLRTRDAPHRCCALTASLTGLVDGPAAAVRYVRDSLDQGPWPDIDGLRTLLLRIAAAGLPAEAAELADHLAAALHLEPIGVALRVRMGQTVDAPTEIHEMVPDLLAEVDALSATRDVWRAPGLGSGGHSTVMTPPTA